MKVSFFFVVFALVCVNLAFSQPSVITFNSPNLYPEGIEWDTSRNQFVVSSTGGFFGALPGPINFVSDDGTLTPFISQNEVPNLRASIGLHIDNGVLHIANTDLINSMNANFTGYLHGYLAVNLTDGQVVADVDLSDVPPLGREFPHLPNDLVVDSNGTVYVTDTFGAQIWEITSDGIASQFTADPLLNATVNPPQPGEINGPNGIELTSSGILLIGRIGLGANAALLRLDLADSNRTVTQVVVDVAPSGADGIYLRPNGNLLVVGNPAQSLFEYQSTDNWVTATLVDSVPTLFTEPTTVTLRDNEAYVVHAHFSEPNRTVFEITAPFVTAVATSTDPVTNTVTGPLSSTTVDTDADLAASLTFVPLLSLLFTIFSLLF